MATRKNKQHGRNKKRRERRKVVRDKEEAIKSADKVWEWHFYCTMQRLGYKIGLPFVATQFYDRYFKYRSILMEQ